MRRFRIPAIIFLILIGGLRILPATTAQTDASVTPTPTHDPLDISPDRIFYVSCLSNGVGPKIDLTPFKLVDVQTGNTSTVAVGTWLIRSVDETGAMIPPDSKGRVMVFYRNKDWWITGAALKAPNPDGSTDCTGSISPVPSFTPYQSPTPIPPTFTPTSSFTPLPPSVTTTPQPPTNTPLPSTTPTPRPTNDPNNPVYDAGRFYTADIHSLFGDESPAVVGTYRFYDGGTLDIVPHSLEKCVDSAPINNQSCYTTSSGKGIPISMPVTGCAFRLQDDPSTVVVTYNCEQNILFQTSDGTSPFRGRREIVLAHLDPDTTVAINTGGARLTAGDYLASLCTIATKSSCNITNDLPPYLSVKVRFLAQSGIINATQDETLGFLATPNCLFDDYLYLFGTPTKNPKPTAGCPAPR